jgi:hypothetical protein
MWSMRIVVLLKIVVVNVLRIRADCRPLTPFLQYVLINN